MTQTPSEKYKQRVRDVVKWSKAVLLVVAVTLLGVLAVENARVPASVVFIGWPCATSTAMVMSASFLMGAIVTLLVMFLGRRSGKKGA